MTKVNYDDNGLEVSYIGTSSYKNVGYYSTWQNGWAYVAMISMNREMAKKAGKRAYIWHLSAHDDPRDAAYAAAKFYENLDDNLIALRDTKAMEWTTENIPVWKHDAVDTVENVEARKVKVAKYNAKKAKKPVVTVTEAMIAANAAYKDAGVKLNVSEMKVIREAIEGQILHYAVIEDAYAHTRDIIGSMR